MAPLSTVPGLLSRYLRKISLPQARSRSRHRSRGLAGADGGGSTRAMPSPTCPLRDADAQSRWRGRSWRSSAPRSLDDAQPADRSSDLTREASWSRQHAATLHWITACSFITGKSSSGDSRPDPLRTSGVLETTWHGEIHILTYLPMAPACLAISYRSRTIETAFRGGSFITRATPSSFPSRAFRLHLLIISCAQSTSIRS